MLSKASDRIQSILIGLLVVPWLSSVLADGINSTTEKHGELEARTGDVMTVIHKWPGATGVALLGVAATMGIVINGAVSAYYSWLGVKPGPDKICGKSSIKAHTGEDGTRYKYYAYSYTTGDDCDTTQRAKTTTDALSKAMDEMHDDEAEAVCIDFDHGGTWHGVLGLVTEESGRDPQKVCAGHHNGAKRSQPGFLQLPESAKPKRGTAELVKRTSISVEKSNEVKESSTFTGPDRAQAVVNELAGIMYEKSVEKSCDPVLGRTTDREGVTYYYYYYASGRNCDTTAEIKTVVSALDDAWYHLGDTSAVCMTFSHGGTWRGHLAVSTMQREYPAQSLCDD